MRDFKEKGCSGEIASYSYKLLWQYALKIRLLFHSTYRTSPDAVQVNEVWKNISGKDYRSRFFMTISVMENEKETNCVLCLPWLLTTGIN